MRINNTDYSSKIWFTAAGTVWRRGMARPDRRRFTRWFAPARRGARV